MAHLSDEVSPTQVDERIPALDIVRGLALFGVLQINLIFLSGHIYQMWAGVSYPQGWGGSVLTWVRDSFINGKAMSCFSMLFGVGLCIQMERAQARGHAFGLFAFRRLGALALFGIAHATLIWNGDILLAYALIGLLLLPLLRANVPTIIFAAALAFLAFINLNTALGWLHAPDGFRFSFWYKQASWLLQSANQFYGHGTWVDATRWRVWEWNHAFRSILVMSVIGCLPLFLIGLALWRSGILKDIKARIQTIRRIFHSVFWLGLVLSVLPYAWLKYLPKILGRGLIEAAPLTLALGYFMGVLLLIQKEPWARWLSLLAPVGRMALTNYLAQSLVCTWIFNHYGLGLWGRVTPSGYIFGGVVLYFLQIAWSHWWLARFKFGPAEWLWRSMTYGSLQPFKIKFERVPILLES